MEWTHSLEAAQAQLGQIGKESLVPLCPDLRVRIVAHDVPKQLHAATDGAVPLILQVRELTNKIEHSIEGWRRALGPRVSAVQR